MRVDSARTAISSNGRFVFSTEAVTPVEAAPESTNPLTVLTPDDRALIKAATGYEVSPTGMVTNPSPAPVEPFIAMVASDRISGRLRGQITTPYLTSLFAKYAGRAEELNPDHLAGAVEYLKARGRDKRVDLAL